MFFYSVTSVFTSSTFSFFHTILTRVIPIPNREIINPTNPPITGIKLIAQITNVESKVNRINFTFPSILSSFVNNLPKKILAMVVPIKANAIKANSPHTNTEIPTVLRISSTLAITNANGVAIPIPKEIKDFATPEFPTLSINLGVNHSRTKVATKVNSKVFTKSNKRDAIVAPTVLTDFISVFVKFTSPPTEPSGIEISDELE